MNGTAKKKTKHFPQLFTLVPQKKRVLLSSLIKLDTYLYKYKDDCIYNSLLQAISKAGISLPDPSSKVTISI